MPYSTTEAVTLGLAVQGAYGLYQGTPLALPPGWELLTLLYWAEVGDDAPSCAGFIAKNGGEVTVAIRGTTNLLEILHDVEFFLEPFPFAPVGSTERGMTNLYATLKIGLPESSPRVVEYLRTLFADASLTKLSIAGHSLGGAAVTLLALDVVANVLNAPVPTVCTFASPRIGDKQFCANYDAYLPDTWRIVNAPDYVPSLPPQWTGYAHVDNEIPINSGKTTKSSVGCWHALATYLHALDADVLLTSTCNI